MLPDGGARPTSGPAAGAQRGRPAAKRLPRLGFLKGAALGVVVVLPTVAAGVWVLARAGIGNPAVTMVEALRMATVFAGIAAVLTAGGIGRLAAHASVTPGGVRTAVIRAARAQAIASAGLVIIAAIPHGELPADPWTWSWFAAAGLIGGALSGVIIGLVCGAPVDERLPTVAELARMIPSLLPVAGEVGRARPARPGEVTATVTATVKAPPAPAVDEPAAAATAAPIAPVAPEPTTALPLPADVPTAAGATAPAPDDVAPAIAEPAAVDDAPASPPDRDHARRQRRAGRKALVVETARQDTPGPKLVRPERMTVERSGERGATGAPTTPVATPSLTSTTGGGTPLPEPVPLGESMPVRAGSIDPDAIEETNIEGRIGDTVDVARLARAASTPRPDAAPEDTVTGVTSPEITGVTSPEVTSPEITSVRSQESTGVTSPEVTTPGGATTRGEATVMAAAASAPADSDAASQHDDDAETAIKDPA